MLLLIYMCNVVPVDLDWHVNLTMENTRDVYNVGSVTPSSRLLGL